MNTPFLESALPDLSRFKNDRYHHGRSLLVRILWILVEAAFLKNPFVLWSGLKIALLRAFGAKVGRGVLLKPSVSVKHPWLLEIGADTWIGENVWIDNLAPVSIGPDCCISQGAMLLTGNHDYGSVTFDLFARPITLRRGSWVGAKSLVCPGITLGAGSVLTAGSVATKDLEELGIYQGNPAVLLRTRHITETRHQSDISA